MAVKLDGTQNALILDATSIALTIKSGVNVAPWTWTFPTGPGTAGQVLSTNGSGVTTWVTQSGGGGTPGGANGQVQFNNAGAFGADASFTYAGLGSLVLGLAATNDGTINLYNSGTANALQLRARNDSTAWTLEFPSGPGTNGLVLTTDGTGRTSWQPAGGAIAVSNDVTTATAEYPLFAAVTTGTLSTVYTASPDYTYTPAAGELSAPHTVSSTGIGLNSNFIATSYTIPAGTNGISAGTLTFAAGATVTTPAGTNWVIA
jgi:hypothetical protein